MMEKEVSDGTNDTTAKQTDELKGVSKSVDMSRQETELIEGVASKMDLDLDDLDAFKLSHTVDCKGDHGFKDPYLFDVVGMEVEGSEVLLVSDFNNNLVRYVYKKKTDERFYILRFANGPRCITKLGDNKVAVTIPDSKQIAIVAVTAQDSNLTLESTITTEKEYWGLTALTPTTLAAGSLEPPGVDILDMSGKVLRSINPLDNGEEMIENPYFLCTTRQGNILVSDSGSQSVLCVTPQGEVVFNYSPTGDQALQIPRGITSTAAGHILVVDWLSHKVLQLNESGEFVRELLANAASIFYPCGISMYDRETIYVTYYTVDNGEHVEVYSPK